MSSATSVQSTLLRAVKSRASHPPYYTTDVDAFIANAGVVGERTGAAGVAPPGTLLGVARLAFPELMIELEATAVA